MDKHDHEPTTDNLSRRHALQQVAVVATAAVAGSAAAMAQGNPPSPYADPANPALPKSTMELIQGRTALVVVDPQNDFLTEKGVAWGVVGESVREHNVVENLERLFKAAKEANLPVVVSPHYYYPTDHGWKFEGTLERVMHSLKMFDRVGPTDLNGFEGSGADFVDRYKPYIYDRKTIIASPHKIYGPEQNDVGLQLRKQRVDQVILAGMSSNLCVESHMRELMEQGFEVAVVRDATAGAKVPDGDGYLASLINFRMIANALWTTDEAVARMGKVKA